MWRVQSPARRYLFGAPALERLDGPPGATGHPGRRLAIRAPGHVPAPPPDRQPRIAPRPEALGRHDTSIAPALGWLLGGYAVVSALVAWMLANGNPQHDPIRALAPISLLISIFVAIGALTAAVFAGRRYLVVAIGTLGLAVGVVVASASAMVTATF